MRRARTSQIGCPRSTMKTAKSLGAILRGMPGATSTHWRVNRYAHSLRQHAFMSVEYVARAIEEHRATGNDRLILIALADHADADGYCYPKQATLADRLGIGLRTVVRGVQRLEELGIIQVAKREDVRAGNAYLLYPDWPSARVTRAKVTRVTAMAPAHVPTVALQESPIEPPVEREARATALATPSEFFVFWDKYPRKVGKPAAARAWTAAMKRGDDAFAILRALEMHMPSMLGNDMEFIPHPATWLNQERYKDQPEKPRQRAVGGPRAPRPSRDEEIKDFLSGSLGLDNMGEIGR